MNLGRVILLGKVTKCPSKPVENSPFLTFEMEVDEETNFKSHFNIQYNENYYPNLIKSLHKLTPVYVEGLIRGQAMKRKFRTNQTLVIIFAKKIEKISS